MDANDFLIWAKRYSEAIGDKPTPEQWRQLVKVLDATAKPDNDLVLNKYSNDNSIVGTDFGWPTC
jgi:hypothetical protein